MQHVSWVALWLAPWLLLTVLMARSYRRSENLRRELAGVTREFEMLRSLVDSLPDFIYAKDAQCKFVFANAFCCKVMGTTAQQIVGRSDFDFYPQQIANSFHEDEKRVLASGDALLSRQEDVVDCAGQRFTILTTKVPWYTTDKKLAGIMGIGRDITMLVEVQNQLRAAQAAMQAEMHERERMAIELRLAQKLESVGRLAAGLAHEINTPVQYVGDSTHFLNTAFADLFKLFCAYRDVANQCADEDTRTHLRTLETDLDLEFLGAEVPRAIERSLEGMDRVARIVRAMKEFAHPDAGEHKPADLNRALSTTLTVAHSEYRHVAQVETELGSIPDVVCNVGELNQVFLNLIVNAAHAIADAHKELATGLITIKTRSVQDEVEISIADNGCGIPEQNLEKIFDPFFTTKEVGRGTGQGLALTRTIIVDRHGGKINVRSEPGIGSTFTIRLHVAGGRARRGNVDCELGVT